MVLVEADALPVLLAPGPISQILDVLLENALAHGAGAIRVEADSADGYLRIRVGDEGKPSMGSDIFRRHDRGHVAPDSPGSGLGLAVATEIAEALGGHLRLEPDDRTTFSLLLPKPAPSRT